MSMKSTLPSPNVSIEISGGFGNQLFQLAAAEHLRSYGIKVSLDFTVNQRNGVRDNLITDIAEKLSFPYLELASWQTILWRIPVLRRIFSLPKGARVVNEDEEFLVPPVIVTDQKVVYRGYWQNIHSAATIREEISDHFEIYPKAVVARIALHVRRGDYLQGENPNFHGVLSGEYYVAAVNSIRSKIGFLPVVVFTDSPNLVSNEKWTAEIADLTFSESLGIFEDFVEIANSYAIVCSNSTYSWWAAYISKSESIVLPSQWQVRLDIPEGLRQARAEIVSAFFVGQD